MKRFGFLMAMALCALLASAQLVAAAPDCKKGACDAPEAPLPMLLPLVAIVAMVAVWAIVARVRHMRAGAGSAS